MITNTGITSKNFSTLSLALFLGFLLIATDAEARRGGGGGRRSSKGSSYYKAAAVTGTVAAGTAVAVAASSTKTSQGSHATARLNVRAEPTSDAKILGKIEKGAPITIESSAYANFYQITYKNQRGFVSKRYVK
ncbi:MAG: SH3 domain-containing protein [Vibrionaceae bacterium]